MEWHSRYPAVASHVVHDGECESLYEYSDQYWKAAGCRHVAKVITLLVGVRKLLNSDNIAL